VEIMSRAKDMEDSLKNSSIYMEEAAEEVALKHLKN